MILLIEPRRKGRGRSGRLGGAPQDDDSPDHKLVWPGLRVGERPLRLLVHHVHGLTPGVFGGLHQGLRERGVRVNREADV